jgi:hypothetical protein
MPGISDFFFGKGALKSAGGDSKAEPKKDIGQGYSQSDMTRLAEESAKRARANESKSSPPKRTTKAPSKR